MKEIKLQKDKGVVLVDDEDYELLSKYKWHLTSHAGKGYATVHIKMHRMIMNITDGNQHIDHADGNSLNNQKINLRICTHSQNMANKKGFKNTSSKYKGVYTHIDSNNKTKHYGARIQKDKKSYFLGYFPFTQNGEIEAAKIYNTKAKELFGDFAYINPIS